jgi:CheY-like chemotaxis protein
MTEEVGVSPSWFDELKTSPGCVLGPRAVVAEDDPCLRHLIACILAEAGLFVTEVNDAAELVRMAASRCCAAAESFNLIVADLPLRGGQGFEPLERIRQAGCHGPAIVITNTLDESGRAQLQRLDADHATKPFFHQTLRALASRVRFAYEKKTRSGECLR